MNTNINTSENIIEAFHERVLSVVRDVKRHNPRAFIFEGMAHDCVKQFRYYLNGGGSINQIERFLKEWSVEIGPAKLLLWRECNRRIAMGDTLHGRACEWPENVIDTFKVNAPNWLRCGCHLTKDGDKFALWGVYTPGSVFGLLGSVSSVFRCLPRGWTAYADKEKIALYIRKVA